MSSSLVIHWHINTESIITDVSGIVKNCKWSLKPDGHVDQSLFHPHQQPELRPWINRTSGERSGIDWPRVNRETRKSCVCLHVSAGSAVQVCILCAFICPRRSCLVFPQTSALRDVWVKWESSHGHSFKPSSSPRFPPGNKLQWDQGTLLLHIRNTKLLPVPVESGSPPSQSRVSVPPAPSAPPGEAHTEKSALPTRFSKNQRCKKVLNDSKSADGF